MKFWQRKPVMVFFQGGGFTGGSGDAYNADDLAKENDVIGVTALLGIWITGVLIDRRLRELVLGSTLLFGLSALALGLWGRARR